VASLWLVLAFPPTINFYDRHMLLGSSFELLDNCISKIKSLKIGCVLSLGETSSTCEPSFAPYPLQTQSCAP
jgi:hypothetical protein